MLYLLVSPEVDWVIIVGAFWLKQSILSCSGGVTVWDAEVDICSVVEMHTFSARVWAQGGSLSLVWAWTAPTFHRTDVRVEESPFLGEEKSAGGPCELWGGGVHEAVHTVGFGLWGTRYNVYFEFCRWLLIFHSHLVLWFLCHITDIDPACAVHWLPVNYMSLKIISKLLWSWFA